MYCIHCGAEVPDGSKFCPTCGGNLTASQPGAAPDENKSGVFTADVKEEPENVTEFYSTGKDNRSFYERNKGWLWALIIVLIIAILGTLVFFLVKSKMEQQTGDVSNSEYVTEIGDVTAPSIEGHAVFVPNKGHRSNNRSQPRQQVSLDDYIDYFDDAGQRKLYQLAGKWKTPSLISGVKRENYFSSRDGSTVAVIYTVSIDLDNAGGDYQAAEGEQTRKTYYTYVLFPGAEAVGDGVRYRSTKTPSHNFPLYTDINGKTHYVDGYASAKEAAQAALSNM